MSSEREADRALKRQVRTTIIFGHTFNKGAVYEHAWHLSKPRRKSWQRRRLTVRSTPQNPPNGFLLISLPDSQVVNAFHSAMALLGNI